MEFLPPPPLLTAFLIASLVLAVTPGPAVIYVVTRSLFQGRRSGLASVAGIALGNMGNVLGIALGLAALLAASSTAFRLVKIAGALYLIWLGIQALRAPPAGAEAAAEPALAPGSAFRDGALVALLNPKTAIFFAAYLPQFMSPDLPAIPQSLALGSIFIAMALVTDSVYALAASAAAPRLLEARGARAAGRYLSGGTFIGLGLFTALDGRD